MSDWMMPACVFCFFLGLSIGHGRGHDAGVRYSFRLASDSLRRMVRFGWFTASGLAQAVDQYADMFGGFADDTRTEKERRFWGGLWTAAARLWKRART